MTSYKTYLIIFLFFVFNFADAQSIDEIKKNHAKYIWGEGSGSTLKKADQNALSMLINQISTTVESKFEQFTEEDRENNEFDLKQKVKSVVKTYSNATLHNTERLVISNEPDAKVFRYIKRKDVDKVFAERKNKINNFIKFARKAEKQIRIADALRYYYSALILLKSHPDCNAIENIDEEGNQYLLISWIPAKMDEIFSQINFGIRDIDNSDEMKTVYLLITFDGKPVVNLDFSYWDGRDWSNLYSAKNGEGFLEYYGTNAKDRNKARIKSEYMYENMAKIDNELENVMEKIDPIPFRSSYCNINFEIPNNVININIPPVKTNIASVKINDKYSEVISQLTDAIDKKQYQDVKRLFTKNGFEMFNKLITYGNASIMSKSDLKVYHFNNVIMCRSIKMTFCFKNNFKKFVEDVVFHFNKKGKIESLSFGLSNIAFKSIFENNTWSEAGRLVLVNFLEHFKTAYALERIDYIESIFADDALIITGYLVEKKAGLENKYRNNQIIRYNRQSKQQYIRNLKYSFNSKEFINIQFEESEVRKGGDGGNIYGVRIKQNYYSSNYGDTGYLFLIVDLENTQLPVIHVRTWQPDKTGGAKIYGLSDF
ncbi:MAG: LPP20 family lipoprotein [Bacteroidales bacterium]|nr:LPP20 family lipoprotein [Bacteroidales bacterium]